jgi:hypothetical protein
VIYLLAQLAGGVISRQLANTAVQSCQVIMRSNKLTSKPDKEISI